MDEVKIVTDFLTGALSKIVSKKFKKTFGINADIHVKSLTIQNDDQKAKMHLVLDADMSNEELKKLMLKVIGF